MSQYNNTSDNNNLPFTWSIEDTNKLSKLTSELTTEKSGIFEISFKDIWSKFAKGGEKLQYRRFVQNKCRKLLQQQNISNYRKVKLIISRHWGKDEENLLVNILKEMGEMGKNTSEINWNNVYEQFIQKRGRNDRDKKALQERYRNYLDPKVYLPNKRKRFTFTEEQTFLIIDYKVNGKIGWKEIADKLNEVIDMQNELNEANGKKIKLLPRCTPNQVKNKYNTVTKLMKDPLYTLAKTAELRIIQESKETGEINKMEEIEKTEETETETCNKMEEIEKTEETETETCNKMEEIEKTEETETETRNKMDIKFITTTI
ncbi:hypothetical protein Glove_74g247 [Diversispora epigaea]|uniref:Myb-like domain-containing protein n=1 Tax=Diversispora epigaea TaxID=1348612 RepID=A0A397JIQ2_9GLOM|nr:hypothetical protein Glove_74g247 [Diversispora epigaea]